MMSLLLPTEIINLLNRASWKQGSDQPIGAGGGGQNWADTEPPLWGYYKRATGLWNNDCQGFSLLVS